MTKSSLALSLRQTLFLAAGFLALAGATSLGVPADEKEQPEAVRIHIAGIRMVGPDQALLLLADEKEERAVPMAVGRNQGIAIALGQEGTPTPRPMTHDLLVHILKALGASVDRITVTELKQDTYYAEIALRTAEDAYQIDARPSDAIALAVRLDAPMFASAGLLRLQMEDDDPDLVARSAVIH
jgi:bifunctional DNase/RNase